MLSVNDDFLLGYGCCLIRNIMERDDKYNEQRQRVAMYITYGLTDYIDEATAFNIVRDISEYKKRMAKSKKEYPKALDKIGQALKKRYDGLKAGTEKLRKDKIVQDPDVMSPLCREMAYYACGRHTYMPVSASAFIEANLDCISGDDRKAILAYIKPMRDKAYEENARNGYYMLETDPQYERKDDYMSRIVRLLENDSLKDTVWDCL